MSFSKKDGTKTTFNVGVVEGGTSVNTIPQHASMLFEYRSNDRECLAYMKEFFEKTIDNAKEQKLADIQVELVGNRPCDGNIDKVVLDKLTQEIVEICEKYSGLACRITQGSTDCNMPLSLGIPAVCVGNYIGEGTHTREERILIESIPIGYKITAHVILKYFE